MPSFKVLGIELGGLSDGLQFVICAGGMFSFMLLHGYYEELVVKKIFKKQYPLFLTLVRFAMSALFAAGERTLRGERGLRAPLRGFVIVSLLLAASMALTNTALLFINYPIKIMFKSSKPIPVMLISSIVFQQSYNAAEYACVSLMVMGICIFAGADLGEQQEDQDRMWIGIGMMLGALCADGFFSCVSAHTFSKYGCSQSEVHRAILTHCCS
jgi:adenosine 3'-phospho 5'-phosphosulfate transporter B3